MQEMNHYPKSIKKAIRYIKQEAKKEQLAEIKLILENAIKRREYMLDKTKD
ncbi:hypothetical protein V7138_06075 [Bacillus sp. JJ1533]|uniref:hypothetical protein n=1 Tax=Bacillus sp. JJ1533 TaxID=3122959 RepID=UPI0030002B9C